MALRLNGGYKNRTHPAPLLEVDQAALQETQRWPLSRADLSQCAVLWKHKHSQEHAEGEKPSAPHFSHTVERLKKKHLCSSEHGQQSVGLSQNRATCGPDLPRSQHRIECCSLREMDLLCSFTCSFVKHFGLLMCVNCARNKPVLPRLEKAVKRACVFAYVFFLACFVFKESCLTSTKSGKAVSSMVRSVRNVPRYGIVPCMSPWATDSKHQRLDRATTQEKKKNLSTHPSSFPLPKISALFLFNFHSRTISFCSCRRFWERFWCSLAQLSMLANLDVPSCNNNTQF